MTETTKASKTMTAQEMFTKGFNGERGLTTQRIVTRKKINRTMAYEIAFCYSHRWKGTYMVAVLEADKDGNINYRSDLLNSFRHQESAKMYVETLKYRFRKRTKKEQKRIIKEQLNNN